MYRLLVGLMIIFTSVWSVAEVVEQPLRNTFSTPDISDKWVSFSYDGNLWLVPRDGGMAHQLTNQDALVIDGQFSPDGASIAYSMAAEGNKDVYVMPVMGGVSKRLTFHPEEDSVIGWHPTKNQLLFKSMRESFRPRFNQFYHASPEGGQIEKLPLTYAETGSYCTGGRYLAYTYTNDFQDGNETWKRYKGGRAPDIWLYDADQQTVEAVTQYEGIDMSPMCMGDDIYFLSDRGEEKRANLWVRRGYKDLTTQSAVVEQITHFSDQDIHHPSAGDNAIVFENDGFLYVYEVDRGELNKLDIQIAAQQRNMSVQAVPLSDDITDISFSADGEQVYLAARGEILSYQLGDKILKNLTQTPGVAERFPSSSVKGVLAYMSDSKDEYQLFTQSQSDEVKQHTDYSGGFRFKPFWSPDGRYLTFADETQKIHLLDSKSGKDTIIGRSNWKTYYALQAMTFSWSEDSKWLLFNMANEGRNQASFLYDLKSQRLHQITAGFYNDQQAIFCGNGAFICLLSQRHFSATHGDVDYTWTYSDSSGLFLMPLQAATLSPYRGIEEGDDNAQVYEWKGIDSLELEQRLISTSVKNVQIRSIYASEASGKSHLTYQRKAADGEQGIYSFNINSGEETLLLDKAELVDVSAGGHVLALNPQGKKYQLTSLESPKKIEQIDLSSYRVQVDPQQEKYQVVRDAWRFYRDFYYDPELHGRDWQAEWQRYAQQIEGAHSNEDINRIVRELGGELEGGHVWATSTFSRVRWKNKTVGLLGVDFEVAGNHYRIKKVYAPAAWLHEDRSPLADPGLPNIEGKYLLAINGTALKANQSPWQALEGLLDKPVELSVSDSPNGKNSQTIRVKTIGSERRMREMDWVESNRRYVDSKTQGRVGYIYVPDTGRQGQDMLMKQYQAQYHKDALIIDARFNSGGALGDRFIELLNRPVLNYFSTRNAQDSQLPELANSGPKLLITNGWSYSGGDGFPFLFQQAGVGPVLGERTWGGLIGPSQPIPLINGGAVSPAPQRVYDREGNWGTGGDIGVTPDIPVKNLPGDLIKGIDAQLDRSIEWALQQLSAQKPKAVPPIAR